MADREQGAQAAPVADKRHAFGRNTHASRPAPPAAAPASDGPAVPEDTPPPQEARGRGDADERRQEHRADRERPQEDVQGEDRRESEEDKGRKRPGRWPLIIGGLVLLIAIIGGAWYWWSHRNQESTDDAYTEGRAVTIAPKVSGYVAELAVKDNQFVHAGDLLLRIDASDLTAQRNQARANLQLARAQLDAAQVQLQVAQVRAPAQLEQAQAQLRAAQASQAQAEAEYRRQRRVDPRATTQSSIDTANAQLQAQTAQVAQAEAQLRIARLTEQDIQLAQAAVEQRKAQVAQAEAQLSEAETMLSYAVLRAPQDGWVTRRNVEQGGFVQPGSTLMSLVTPNLWITANFKETQLTAMEPGQPVTIEVDAYPDLELRGHVDSIQMGSGARFSAFPAENATGNFVKIVRRVPVKIAIDSGLPEHEPLPLGISVVPTVKVE
ncbi:HlyD family secretion protein [Roseomonas sp. E05]|uniref:HlyD family secretion protein n=1 Tax=Roseomonas sp. E05 TaxID=3046310 RepID=UPI0024B87A47|nr:HlyD family secretion protein [Roseomonas sp. E05]MDJ0387588.1 HlyD family secretion protein [Roseomonas sp. E05]